MNLDVLQPSKRKSGQAIIFLLMVLLIGTVVVLFNFDVHKIVSTKMRINNAADAAALSAARWQGVSLNMIGELNLIQAAFAAEMLYEEVEEEGPQDDEEIVLFFSEEIGAELEALHEIRARLTLTGPLMGLVAAQSAARLNLRNRDVAMREPNYSAYFLERAIEFQTCGGLFMGEVPEPYVGAWEEYGDVLHAIATAEVGAGQSGLLVQCGNPQPVVYHKRAKHLLLDPNFYRAVAAGYWCYFAKGQNRVRLEDFVDYTSWHLSDPVYNEPINSEYFSLNLRVIETELSSLLAAWEEVLTNYYPEIELDEGTLPWLGSSYIGMDLEEDRDSETSELGEIVESVLTWHYYDPDSWLKSRYNGRYWPTSTRFPFQEGWRVREQYDYGGADAAVDCYVRSENVTAGLMGTDVDWIQWQSAAKPFGYLDIPVNPADPDGAVYRSTPVFFGLVLPAFHDARLIHNDLSSRPSGVIEPGYEEHINKHLFYYAEMGMEPLQGNGCWYCEQLRRWEDPSFRAEGLRWLEENQALIDADEVCTNLLDRALHSG